MKKNKTLRFKFRLPMDMLQYSVDVLEIPEVVSNALKSNKIFTIDDLIENHHRLHEMNRLGQKKILMINRALLDYQMEYLERNEALLREFFLDMVELTTSPHNLQLLQAQLEISR